MSTTLTLTGLHCGACVGRVKAALEPLAETVTVTLTPPQAVLSGLNATVEQVVSAVASAGAYTAEAQAAPAPVDASANMPISWLATYQPLLLIVLFIAGAATLPQVRASLAMQHVHVVPHEWMADFMGAFFVVFAFFKLLNLRAFAKAYAGYDLLAKRWLGWGFVYPFVELALGLAYLLRFEPTLVAWATILLLGFSAVGVIAAVLQRRAIACACLGTVFQLPMSTVTIVEDLGMVAMAAWMLHLPG